MSGLKEFEDLVYLVPKEKRYRLRQLRKEMAKREVDIEIIPYLNKLNEISWLVTTQSCCGHKGYKSLNAHLDMRIGCHFQDFFLKLKPFIKKYGEVSITIMGLQAGMPRFVFWLDLVEWEKQLKYLIKCLENRQPSTE